MPPVTSKLTLPKLVAVNGFPFAEADKVLQLDVWQVFDKGRLIQVPFPARSKKFTDWLGNKFVTVYVFVFTGSVNQVCPKSIEYSKEVSVLSVFQLNVMVVSEIFPQFITQKKSQTKLYIFYVIFLVTLQVKNMGKSYYILIHVI